LTDCLSDTLPGHNTTIPCLQSFRNASIDGEFRKPHRWNVPYLALASPACAGVNAGEQSPRTTFQASKNGRKDVLDARLYWLAKPLAGDRIVRVRPELSE
jgi:hypothetical protein